MIFILLPIFNEAENIPNLFKELAELSLDDNFFYVFSDDGSTDRSYEVINSFFKDKPFVILGDGINRGPGFAFNSGFQWIISQSKSPEDIIVTMEADCTSDLSILPLMIFLCKSNYDLVLASVYAQGGGFEKTSYFRKLISTIANYSFRIIFDVHVQTLSSFYRVYRISLIKKLNSEFQQKILKENGFVSMLEILLKAIKNNASIIEVPMKLRSSKRIGKSKMKVFQTSIRYLQFLVKTKIKGLS